MRHRASVEFLAVFLLVTSVPCWGDWQNQLALYSDYFHRGMTYPEQPSSINWLSEYRFNGGLYVGVWASVHDDDTTFRNNEELDFWMGYSHLISKDIALDVSWTEFVYPNDEVQEYDWSEVMVSLHLAQRWTLAAGFNRDHFAEGDTGKVVEVTHRSPWFGNLIDLTAGYVESDNFGDPVVTVGSTNDDGYGYYEIGISRSLSPLDNLSARVAIVGTNQNDLIVHGEVFADKEWAISLNYSF